MDAGALGETLELVYPMGANSFDGGLLLAGPLECSGGGEATVSGALHGLGELEADEVAEVLAVLEAEVVRGTGEFGEGEVDGEWGCGWWREDT